MHFSSLQGAKIKDSFQTLKSQNQLLSVVSLGCHLTRFPFPSQLPHGCGISPSGCHPKEGRASGWGFASPLLLFWAGSSSPCWCLRLCYHGAVPQLKEGLTTQCSRKREWWKINFKKSCLINRDGKNVFKIKYRVEYNTFLLLPLLCKHCLLF